MTNSTNNSDNNVIITNGGYSNMLSMIIFNSVSLMMVPYIMSFMLILILFICYILGITYKKISDTHDKIATNILLKSLTKHAWCSMWSLSKGILLPGTCVFCSYEYKICGWVIEFLSNTKHGDEIKYSIFVLSSNDNLDKLLGKYTIDSDEILGTKITIYGHKWHKESFSKPLDMHVISNPMQNQIISEIMSEFNHGVVALIHGPAGTGKTAIGEILAHNMVANGINVTIVNGYNPGMQGCFIHEIMNDNTDTVLVFIFNEFDELIKKVENNTINVNTDYEQEIYDKETISSYFDVISSIPKAVFIVTTNEPISWWNEPKREYITRDSRFSHKFYLPEMTENHIIETFKSGLIVFGFPDTTKIPDFTDNMKMATIAAAFKRCKGNVAILYHKLGCYPNNTTKNDWKIEGNYINQTINIIIENNAENIPLLHDKTK
jgi:hypothetical protein